MFGFDNTKDDGTQPPQDQNQQQNMGAPAVPDPSSPPPVSNDNSFLNTDPPAPDPMMLPPADHNNQDGDLIEPVNGSANDLLNIKQEALQKLSPLVNHLDQSPEEKFKTTMMMIQASDDQSLVGAAYEAANAIADEKTKAQALLDIVNEINYFTQHHKEA